jgi:bacterioferritin
MTKLRSVSDSSRALVGLRWSWLERRVDEPSDAASTAADRKSIVNLMNDVLATQIVSMLRYRRHHFIAHGSGAVSVAAGFLSFAIGQQVHADEIARRIVQLGGKPDLDPRNLCDRSRSEYVECETLDEMIFENLVAARATIGTYEDLVGRIGSGDAVSRNLLASILVELEAHVESLAAIPRARPVLDARIAQLRADHYGA